MRSLPSILFLLLLLLPRLTAAQSLAEMDPARDPAGPLSVELEFSPQRAALDSAQLYTIIESAVSDYNIPGAAVSAIKFGEVVWSSTHGFANPVTGAPLSDATTFMLASISKTCVAIALMQLVEDGLLNLDLDVDQYLPFDVDNPYYPYAAITTRMLLTHTSSISVKNSTWLDLIVEGQDSPIGLHQFLSEYLVLGGSMYAADNYTNTLPGSSGEYSNVGYTLAGYLVEVITGQSLEDYCQQNIFGPLQMTETSWLLSPLDVDQIAMPTAFQNNAFVPYGHYCFPTFPCGQWRSSLRQLTRYLEMFMNKGELDGVRILEEATVDEMMEIQYPTTEVFQGYDWGLGWFRIPAFDGYVWGHTGGLFGVATFMFFDPVNEFGFIELTNGDGTAGQSAILDAIYLYARDLEPAVPVLVSGLRAERQDDGSARMSWMTPGTIGGPRFHIWRESSAGQRERISTAAIQAGMGGECSFIDVAAPRSRVTYWLQMLDDDASTILDEPAESSWVGSVAVSAAAPLGSLLSLRGSYPNPFREETALSFETGRPAEVKVEVYDLRGRRVKTLIDERLPAGSYRPVWRGEDEAGRPVSIGTYIYRVQVGERMLTEKVTRK